jgi:hypothetical protein
LARQSFEQWYNAEYIRPIIPADRTEGGYQHPDAQAAWDAWQAALSHAEGEAVEIEAPEFHAEGMGCGLEDRGITDRYEAMEYGFNEAVEQYEAIIDGYGQLYTHPAPQVAVPEAKNLDALTDREDKLMAAGWNECRAAMLAAAPTAPAGELVTRCTAGLGCDEKGHCDAAATGQGDMCDRRTMAHERPVSDPDGLGAQRAQRLETATVAKLLFKAWSESEPDHAITQHPASYAETFTDMARAIMPMLSTPAPDEREIAALALERHADNLIVMAERDGRNSDRESQQTWEEAAYFAKQEAKRLRAGKEGE